MKFRAILREGLGDISSGTTRFTQLGIALALMICGLVVADSSMILQQLNAADAFRASGAATLVLEAPGRVDSEACENLRSIPGVSAAGALRESSEKLVIAVLPDAPVPLYSVSAGFPDVLEAKIGTQIGIIVSDDLATSLSLGLEDDVPAAEGYVPVSGTYSYPSDGRRAGLGYAVLSVVNDQAPFDECWVTSWPQIANLQNHLLASLTVNPPDEQAQPEAPTVSQLNTSLGVHFLGNQRFETRVTRAAPLAALILGLAIGFGAGRLRRLQFASALHAGVKRIDLICIQLLQAVAWILPASLMGLGTAAGLASLAGMEDAQPFFVEQAAIPLAAFAGAVFGVYVFVATVEEKYLFRFFKDR